MKLITIRDPRSTVDVMVIADLHSQSRECMYDKFESAINRALHEKMRVIFLGDMHDVATSGSITAFSDDDKTLQQSIDYCSLWFGKLVKAGLLDAAVGGNHMRRLWKFAGVDVERTTLQRAGLDESHYDSESAIIRYEIGSHAQHKGDEQNQRKSYMLYAHHTSRGGRLQGSALNSVADLQKVVIGADFYLAGHTHQLLQGEQQVTSWHRLPTGCVELETHHVTLVSCGSFLRYGGYAEAAAMGQAVPGYAILHLCRTDKGRQPTVELVKL